jgi:hypothetical protein
VPVELPVFVVELVTVEDYVEVVTLGDVELELVVVVVVVEGAINLYVTSRVVALVPFQHPEKEVTPPGTNVKKAAELSVYKVEPSININFIIVSSNFGKSTST